MVNMTALQLVDMQVPENMELLREYKEYALRNGVGPEDAGMTVRQPIQQAIELMFKACLH